jgi:lysozyme
MIKDFEGFAPVAFCHADGTWTAGFGHTLGVKKGDQCSKPQALAWLFADTAHVARAIRLLVNVELNSCQFDALVSLVYNIGVGAFHKSTLLKNLNIGDMGGVAAEWLRWDHVHGKIEEGLRKRRVIELRLFQTVG